MLVLGKPLKRRRQVRSSLGEQRNVKSNFRAHWGSLLSAGGKLTVTVALRPSVDNVPALNPFWQMTHDQCVCTVSSPAEIMSSMPGRVFVFEDNFHEGRALIFLVVFFFNLVGMV